MNLIWAAGGAAVGLAAGASLRGVVYRASVGAGQPDEAACRECGAWLPAAGARSVIAATCSHCGRWFGAPMVIELTAAATIALLCARFGSQPAIGAFAWIAATGVALAQIDSAVQRLPDRLTLPAYPALIAALAIAAVSGRDGAALARSLLGGLALAAVYLMLGLVSGGQLGGGDIKLAGLLGIVLGWAGWPAVLVGAALGFVLAAITSLVLLAARRISRRSTISFGPYMLSGALLAILVISS